jgi:hypothetical protein
VVPPQIVHGRRMRTSVLTSLISISSVTGSVVAISQASGYSCRPPVDAFPPSLFAFLHQLGDKLEVGISGVYGFQVFERPSADLLSLCSRAINTDGYAQIALLEHLS